MKRFSEVTATIKRRTPAEHELLMKQRQEFCYKFSQLWKDSGLDVVVTPAYPHCSFPSEQYKDLGITFDYTFLWSVLEYPAGILTVTKVREDEQHFADKHNDGWTKLFAESAKDS
jgi:hypothetical protein